MESSPNLTFSSSSVAPAVAKVPKPKISSETTDSFIFPLVIFWESKGKKVATMLKWLKISSRKESCCPPPWLLNYSKNAYLFMETGDTCLTVFQEISKIGKNSKSNFQNMLLLEISSTLIAHIKYWSKESWAGLLKAEGQMIILKLSKKDLKPLKIKQFQSLKTLKVKEIALRSMLWRASKMFMKICKKSFHLTTFNHQLLRKWFLFWAVQVLEKERKIYNYLQSMHNFGQEVWFHTSFDGRSLERGG